MSQPPTVEELLTLAPDPEDHDDYTAKVRVGDLRALLAIARSHRSIVGAITHMSRIEAPEVTAEVAVGALLEEAERLGYEETT